MAKKVKSEKIDGLGPDDLKRIHKMVRQAWQWSHPWRLAKKRALGADGFYRCENRECPQRGKPVAKVSVDHISPVGEVGGPLYIQKLFVPSNQLQCLCKPCHDKKTKGERKKSKPVKTVIKCNCFYEFCRCGGSRSLPKSNR